jgi:hypothetical protein
VYCFYGPLLGLLLVQYLYSACKCAVSIWAFGGLTAGTILAFCLYCKCAVSTVYGPSGLPAITILVFCNCKCDVSMGFCWAWYLIGECDFLRSFLDLLLVQYCYYIFKCAVSMGLCWAYCWYSICKCAVSIVLCWAFRWYARILFMNVLFLWSMLGPMLVLFVSVLFLWYMLGLMLAFYL